jgi:hypothetical protein
VLLVRLALSRRDGTVDPLTRSEPEVVGGVPVAADLLDGSSGGEQADLHRRQDVAPVGELDDMYTSLQASSMICAMLAGWKGSSVRSSST